MRRGGRGVTVSQDATSSKYVPASSAEWSRLLADAGISNGGPSSLWLCQESSGNLADSIGSVTLTAAGSPGYQQAVTGWSRKAVTIANGTTTDKFAAAAGAGPNVAAESVLWLFYLSIPASPAALRHAAAAAAYPTGRSFAVSSTGKIVSYLRNQNVNSLQTHTAVGVFPLVLQYDRTNGTAITFSHLEKITHSYVSTAVDGAKGVGSLDGTAAVGLSVVYMAAFKGVAAELSTTQVKTLLTQLGWSPTFTP